MRRVLVLGALDHGFELAYTQAHRDAQCVASDGQDPATLAAAARDCDLVVMPDGLGTLSDPPSTLKLLARHCPEGVGLYLEFALPADNLAREATTPAGHAAQARKGSRACLAKLLMDAGWMPDLVDHTLREGPQPIEGLLLEAMRCFPPVDHAPSQGATFAVVVPTNHDAEFASNVMCSPGLSEREAPIYTVRDATSPADALNTALPHIAQDWVLLCHQDVYFPEGFGHRLTELLAAIPAQERSRTLLGFVGKSVDAQQRGYRNAGFVIDRMHRMDHADSAAAVSIDELAIVIARDSLHRIDPALGWHLWATDLCLTAICHLDILPRIVRLPLFHNSRNNGVLPAAFHAAGSRLLDKFPNFGPIPTLCGTLQPKAVPGPKPAAVPVDAAPTPSAGCCICGQPVTDWMPHPHIATQSEFMKLIGAVGSDLSVYQCPACFSTDRDRHLWHYMNAAGLLDAMGSMRVLHIAPERHIEALLRQVPPRHYVRGDLHPQRGEHIRLNVEALDFADASFDLIICNHVLEHVGSPETALAEFHRCLAPGGTLIAQTPYAPGLRNTFEMLAPVATAFAEMFYGQDDHVRLFGADIDALFKRAGFQGELLPHDVVLPGLDARAHGCNAREPFFCFSK